MFGAAGWLSVSLVAAQTEATLPGAHKELHLCLIKIVLRNVPCFLN